MRATTLAEAIMLQSMEDLWDARHKAESLDFFSGHRFHACADMAEMGTEEKLKLLNLVKTISRQQNRSMLKEASARSARGQRVATF